MALTSWEVAQLLTRWLLYLGVSSVVGGLFAFNLLRRQPRLLRRITVYVSVGVLVGASATVAYFFILVGATMEQGFWSMFDPEMVSIYWESSFGKIVMVNLSGYALAALALSLFGLVRQNKAPLYEFLAWIIGSFGVACLVYAFSLAGHSTSQSVYYRIGYFFHILIAAWWVGLLLPFWFTVRNATIEESYRVLERFGKLAAVTVPVLLLCGVWMSYVLTGWQGLMSSDYGFWLLLKLALVFTILVIAAYHKLYLVPLMLKQWNTQLLQKSIFIEKVVAAWILVVTAIITTFVGPPIH